MANIFDIMPVWAAFPVTVILCLLASELGYRLGKWWQKRTTHTKDPSLGAMVAASLALLAFLIAFVTGIAESRFDRRRGLILQEANAIGTTELRARYLVEPQRTESRELLRQYVDTRLGLAVPNNLEPVRLRSEEIQSALWVRVTALANEYSDSELFALYVDALNGMIDTHGERVAAITARVPVTLLGTVYIIALLTMMLVGFSNSYEERRSGVALLIFILIFAFVFTLIIDLDRPLEGILRVSQQPLLDLQQQLTP